MSIQLNPNKTYPVELRGIIERANAGDATALPELHAAFTQFPELTAHLGDLSKHAEEAFLALAGNSDVAKEAIRHQLDELRTTLGATATSPLERLLAERIALCWLQVSIYDVDLARRLLVDPAASLGTKATDQRLSSAHRRYLAAIKALATVQKLVKPGLSPVEMLRRAVPETAPGKSGMNLRQRGPAEAVLN